jgi:hypothetical protein
MVACRAEGWQSGRMRRSRKPLHVQACRRFKSSPLRCFPPWLRRFWRAGSSATRGAVSAQIRLSTPAGVCLWHICGTWWRHDDERLAALSPAPCPPLCPKRGDAQAAKRPRGGRCWPTADYLGHARDPNPSATRWQHPRGHRHRLGWWAVLRMPNGLQGVGGVKSWTPPPYAQNPAPRREKHDTGQNARTHHDEGEPHD